MNAPTQKDHFGLSSIRKSLKYFIFGKGSNAFLSIAILFSLARFLSKDDYAVFVSWQAIVIMVGLISTFGTQSVTQRFLAELRTNSNPFIYKFLGYGVALRLLFAILVSTILIFNISFVSSALNIPYAQDLLIIFLLVGALRVTSLTLSQACDALLWQRLSQVGLVAANTFRFIGFICVYHFYGLSLSKVVVIELIAEIIFFTYLVVGVKANQRADMESPTESTESTEWWQGNRDRVVQYGISKYFVSISRAFYGSGPNRLLALNFTSLKDAALFGFADSIIALSRRFMPAVLMVGFIRPVFISRYTKGSGVAPLVDMANLIFRINLTILIAMIVGVLIVGEPVFNLITNGKYGDAYLLIAGFLVLLVFEGLRYILELLIEVVELNRISLISNVVQSSSFVLAIPLFAFIGLWAILVANLIGTMMACGICVLQLNRHDFKLRFETKLVSLILFEGLVLWGCGYLLQFSFGSIYLTIACMLIIFAILARYAPPLRKDEIKNLRSIVNAKKISS